MADVSTFFGTGKFSPPPGVDQYQSGQISGLTFLVSNLLKLTIYAAGLYCLINLFSAGILYIGSSGNPETIKTASARIWMSLLGLVIVASALLLAALIGIIFFKKADFLISPMIPNPGGLI